MRPLRSRVVRFRSRILPLMAALVATAMVAGCAAHRPPSITRPSIISHAAWEEHPPLGYAADATRRNLRAGDSLQFRNLTIRVLEMRTDSSMNPAVDLVRLRLARPDTIEDRIVREGAAFNWMDVHLALLAVYAPGELGGGLAVIELGSLASLPAVVATSDSAGGAALRLKVPHRITHVTLHHTGSAEPLRAEDDPAEKLRGLQVWGARDRNWWDVPYHYLIDLGGRVYEGRDWHFMGETNTTYDPSGHFLISVIGNYGRQEPTPAQLEAIADLMAWALDRFDLPLDRIGGHYNYAGTSCPGQHLRKYLEDGTFRRMVEERLAHR